MFEGIRREKRKNAGKLRKRRARAETTENMLKNKKQTEKETEENLLNNCIYRQKIERKNKKDEEKIVNLLKETEER